MQSSFNYLPLVIYLNCVFECSRIMALVCVAYWFIKNGKLKLEMHKWIVAANYLFLIASFIYSIMYIEEQCNSWFSGIEYERYAIMNRATGPYWWAYWLQILNIIILPNLLWFKKIRHSAWILPVLIFSSLIEPMVILITSLHRDYLPSSWMMYRPFQISPVNLIFYFTMLVGTYYIIRWRTAKLGVK